MKLKKIRRKKTNNKRLKFLGKTDIKKHDEEYENKRKGTMIRWGFMYESNSSYQVRSATPTNDSTYNKIYQSAKYITSYHITSYHIIIIS